jgi:hypothetical protein
MASRETQEVMKIHSHSATAMWSWVLISNLLRGPKFI